MRYFAAINPANNEIESIRSSKSREYKAAVAIQWPGEDASEMGVGSYHRDEALAHKASQQYINRGAYVEIWEVREISKAEHAEIRERFKAIVQGREAQEQEAEVEAEAPAPEVQPVDLVKVYNLSKPMVRDLLGAVGAHVECLDGMTSKALRSRGILAEGQGRQGMLTDEGIQVVRALRDVA